MFLWPVIAESPKSGSRGRGTQGKHAGRNSLLRQQSSKDQPTLPRLQGSRRSQRESQVYTDMGFMNVPDQGVAGWVDRSTDSKKFRYKQLEELYPQSQTDWRLLQS